MAKAHKSRPPLGWLDAEWVVRGRAFPRVFGYDTRSWWSQDALASLGIPVAGHWLDLGCGGGNAEIQLSLNGAFASMVAFDPSAGSIELARADAANHGVNNIDFRVADVNNIELPEAAFDVAHMNMSLHHVVELEHVLFQVNRSLKPGGVFIANEYIGPSQFQFSDERMELVRECLAELPERLRWNPVAAAVKHDQPRHSRWWWNERDDTEAIRSDDIERVIATNFPECRRIDYGGNLLNLVLENIAQNFDPDLPEDAEAIKRLLEHEDELLEREPSDFAYFVCPKGDAASLQRAGDLAANRRDASAAAVGPLQLDDFDIVHEYGLVELESESGSERPGLGPAIVAAKRLVRRALRFHLEPVIRQQRTFNRLSTEMQAKLLEELRDDVAALRRENDDLRRDLAALRRERG